MHVYCIPIYILYKPGLLGALILIVCITVTSAIDLRYIYIYIYDIYGTVFSVYISDNYSLLLLLLLSHFSRVRLCTTP